MFALAHKAVYRTLSGRAVDSAVKAATRLYLARGKEAEEEMEGVQVDYMAELEKRATTLSGHRVKIQAGKRKKIVCVEYQYDEDLEEATMGVEGMMYSDESENITVTITRSTTGIFDQFCAAGNCVPGNGELTQELQFTIGSMEALRRWFTHYTATTPSQETIVYAFNDGANPVVKLTVVYSYKTSAVENVQIPATQGAIYNLLGQRMPSNTLGELPSGIYIINGEKRAVR